MNLKALVWALESLCDADLQEKLWRGEGGKDEIWTIEEAICQVFDDTGLGYAMKKESQIYLKLFALANNLEKQFDKIVKMEEVSEILNSNEILNVRRIAKDMISEIKYITT